jgi:polysaccharide biosynthesis transport protein
MQPLVARVVDRAVPAIAPVKPNKTQIVLVAMVLALLLGALASIVLDRLDNTIKGGDDAEARLKLPVLAALPLVAEQRPAHMVRMFWTTRRIRTLPKAYARRAPACCCPAWTCRTRRCW